MRIFPLVCMSPTPRLDRRRRNLRRSDGLLGTTLTRDANHHCRRRALASCSVRAIHFCRGFCGIWDSTFYLRAFRGGTGPAVVSGTAPLGVFFRVIFAAAGEAIISGEKTRMAADVLAAALFVFFLLLYVPRIIGQLHNPNPWTSGFEVLAMCGSALVLVGNLPREKSERA